MITVTELCPYNYWIS